MRPVDNTRFALGAATGNRLRTVLLMLAMSIGVAAVVVLTALGDGARRYVVNEFSALGTNLVIVLPGRTQTGGFSPQNVITGTPRDLTIDDALAVKRAPAVRRVAPIVVGTSEISAAGRLRETMVVGTVADYYAVRNFTMAQGRFLPEEDWTRGSPVIVLGAKVREELFGSTPALGQFVRIGDRRFRVIGVLGTTGMGLGHEHRRARVRAGRHRAGRCSTPTRCSASSSRRAIARRSRSRRSRCARSSRGATAARRTSRPSRRTPCSRPSTGCSAR